jgi:hypothetical protein
LEGLLNAPEVLKNWADTDVEAYQKADRSPRAGSSILHAEIDRRAK